MKSSDPCWIYIFCGLKMYHPSIQHWVFKQPLSSSICIFNVFIGMFIYYVVLYFTLHGCFSQLLQFFKKIFVINLKDYTGSISCFLNLAKSEPLLGGDQVLFILYLQAQHSAQNVVATQ